MTRARNFSCFAAAAVLFGSLAVLPAAAGDIIAEWASVKPPAPPPLKPVTVDGKTTALLVLDLMKSNCGERPRCAATVPNVQRLVDTHADRRNFGHALVGLVRVNGLTESSETRRQREDLEVHRVCLGCREPAR